MPKSKNQFFRLRIIDEALRKNQFVKTDRIKKLIEDRLGEQVDVRTIQLDIKDMQHDTRLGFDAPIKYDSKKKAFYYTDRSYSILNFALTASDVQALQFYASCMKIYSEYGIFKDFSSAIQKIVDGVSIRQRIKQTLKTELIVQTDTAVGAMNVEFVSVIINAIDEKSKIEFTYKKYGDKKETKRILSPYILKEYKNRWYVLGVLDGNKSISTFALDRMQSLELAIGAFESGIPFDHAKYFKHSFGITTPDNKIEKIILQFSYGEAHYIKALPIHPTQKIIKDSAKLLQITIEVIPSYELFEYILSKTPDVKVISPAHIALRIEQHLKSGLKNYKKK